ncbi:MAG: response regulator [Lachnospiraceae bacterium]|jgi:two-component system KDP operon response regulator KdpE|nr:response regulator [Lachnospiraceae bacterium]MCI9096643.1 response regulator [Lachnospiraceae bacterium]MCI9204620.1 response regulator [Lachnospiraceae bacterium]MCI9334983.1 response regulator [Lachnospiraceae bacterium]
MNHNLAKTSILLIEDEENIRSFISTALKNTNYKITTAKGGNDGLHLSASLCPDLILLDLGLPDLDGMEVIRKLRSWSSIPVIVISARTNEHEKARALDLGADDYITKPFGTVELLARIRTSLRHSHQMQDMASTEPAPYHYKELTIHFENHVVTLSEENIHLTQIEYKLLTLLAKNSGKVLTYTYLMEKIWGPYTDNNNQILRVNMANIRRKIEKNPAAPEYVFTEIGIGYRMAEGD